MNIPEQGYTNYSNNKLPRDEDDTVRSFRKEARYDKNPLENRELAEFNKHKNEIAEINKRF